MFDNISPAFCAISAMIFVMIWQIIGSSLLISSLNKGIKNPYWSMAAGWLLWCPVSGAIVLVFALLKVGNRFFFLGLSLLLVVLGAYSLRKFWATYGKEIWTATKIEKKLFLFGIGIIQFFNFFYAAHPRRLYDQLSYHLVVAKNISLRGDPFSGIFDSHVLFSGLFEYALYFPRALLNDDFFLISAGQSWIYLISLGTIFLSCLALSRHFINKSQIWNFLFVLAGLIFPVIIPNNDMFSIAKPGAILLAGAFLLGSALMAEKRVFLPLVLIICPILVGINVTFLHAGICFGGIAVFLAIRKKYVPSLTEIFLFFASLLTLSVFLLKNWLILGSPVYPALTGFFNSPFADDFTRDAWQKNSFTIEESFLERYLGVFRIPLRSPAFVALIATSTVFYGLSRFKFKNLAQHKIIQANYIWFFLLIFAVSWPIFFGSEIFTRFVAAYIAMICLLVMYTALRFEARTTKVFLWITLLLAVAVSQMEIMGIKICRWDRMSTREAFREQYPTIDLFSYVNRFAGINDLCLANNPAKYFLLPRSLHNILTPGERALWQEFDQDPREAAKRHSLKALILEGGLETEPGSIAIKRNMIMERIYERLKPFGQETWFGADRVLISTCNFEKKEC